MKFLIAKIINFVCRNFLNFAYISRGSWEGEVFLSIVLTDLRRAGIEQKARSFYSVIEYCLANDNALQVVVPLARNVSVEVENVYLSIYKKYLSDPNFNIVFSRPESAKRQYLIGALVALFFAVSLKRRFSGVNRNLSVILSANYIRMWTFFNLFDRLPSKHWLGLTGNIELQALMRRRDAVRSSTTINALQFGQAAKDQHHFSMYSIDRLFVYDAMSEEVYKNLGMTASKILISGSPEFEYSLSSINERRLKDKSELGVLFIDQPVGQRSEYSPEYLNDVLQSLLKISKYSSVTLRVKHHPRGTAFSGSLPDQAEESDISDLLSTAHVVIGFFSNLVDLALLTGRKTFCFGADRVLDPVKIRWMREHGCVITDDTEQLDNFIREFSTCPEVLSQEVMQKRRELGVFHKASQIIIEELEQ